MLGMQGIIIDAATQCFTLLPGLCQNGLTLAKKTPDSVASSSQEHVCDTKACDNLPMQIQPLVSCSCCGLWKHAANANKRVLLAWCCNSLFCNHADDCKLGHSKGISPFLLNIDCLDCSPTAEHRDHKLDSCVKTSPMSA